MRTTILCCLLVIQQILSQAQPGGGGGLMIEQCFNSSLQKISWDDPDLKLRAFILPSDAGRGGILHEVYGGSRNWLSPRPAQMKRDQALNYRLLAIYKKDTVLIDFLNLLHENGGGRRDRMDSLVLQGGYYVMDRQRKEKEERTLLLRGLTPSNTAGLKEKKILHANPVVNFSFLEDKNLPAAYHLAFAEYLFYQKQNTNALQEIAAARRKTMGYEEKKKAEMLSFMTYRQMREWSRALFHINLVVNEYSRSDSKDDGDNELIENLELRIHLLTLMGQAKKALEDYDRILQIAQDKDWVMKNRARLKMDHLQDYAGAIADMRHVIDAIPAAYIRSNPDRWYDYAEIYYILGLAELKSGATEKGTNHLSRAMQFGYSQLNYDTLVTEFTALINQYPSRGALYFCRAIAQQTRAAYLGWGEATQKALHQALADLGTAEESGYGGYLIPLYCSYVLNLLKNHEAALRQSEAAIALNPKDPRCHLARYESRRGLGRVVWGNENDEDILKAREMRKSWGWGRE